MSSIEFIDGQILDGSGASPKPGNVLVDDGRIRRVSDEMHGADRQIDLSGAYLAPGFVDMHSHSELRLFEHPGAIEKLTQGITIEVMGQDGVSVAPILDDHQTEWAQRVQTLLGTKENWGWTDVGEFLDSLSDVNPAINCAYYAPHGNLRSTVAGFENRSLSDDELKTVQASLRTAINEGAFAMSKGMIYPPSSYATDNELVALAEVLAEQETYMVSHIWNESDHIVESIERYLDICERGGCQPLISHLKVAGKKNWGRSTEILDIFDTANDRGLNVAFDQYPYTAGSTMLTALLPPWAREGESDDVLARLRDPETRERIRNDINSEASEWENLAQAAGTWDNILITWTGSGAHEGKTVAEIADNRGAKPVETICDLLLEEELDVTMVDFVMSETDIERFLTDERGTFCTDGIFGGKPHPRVTGTFARIFERYVNDRSVLPIETAVYKAAGRPADLLGLPDRGRIREEYVADLVAFNIDEVSANATYKDPWQLSDGMKYVLVEGEITVEDGEPTGACPGTVLRSTEEWDAPSRPKTEVLRE